jgi:molybdenum cofactor biosynthesis enzyme MoaA
MLFDFLIRAVFVTEHSKAYLAGCGDCDSKLAHGLAGLWRCSIRGCRDRFKAAHWYLVAIMEASADVPDAIISDFQLNVYNFEGALKAPPARYATIRFDPNNTCNLHCVYCHNHRSDKTIDAESFRQFLSEKVQEVSYFQVGCIMEPTLDRRLTDFMLAIAASPAKPSETLMLQTNGLLLHTHDHAKMVEAGLTNLSVSLDVADPETQKELRSGMSLTKVVRNIENFRKVAPDVAVDIISVVSTSNIHQMQGLVDLALNVGAKRVIFRELLYYPESNVVDHAKMRGLLLNSGEFQEMADIIKAKYADSIKMIFAPNDVLDASARLMAKESREGVEVLTPQFHQARM